MNISKLTCLILFFIFNESLVAQNQNNFWFFGHNAGLDFNSIPPVPVRGELYTLEGNASISDT